MTTGTNNPVPSDHPSDLLANAMNFDDAMNSTDPTFTDRLGVVRSTWAGITTSANLGDVIDALPNEPTISDTDNIIFSDTSTSVNGAKKITWAQYKTLLQAQINSTLYENRIEYGSNANGTWQKTYMNGTVVKVEQYMGYQLWTSSVAKSLPVSMPDAEYHVSTFLGSSITTALYTGTQTASQNVYIFKHPSTGATLTNAYLKTFAVWVKA